MSDELLVKFILEDKMSDEARDASFEKCKTEHPTWLWNANSEERKWFWDIAWQAATEVERAKSETHIAELKKQMAKMSGALDRIASYPALSSYPCVDFLDDARNTAKQALAAIREGKETE